MMRRWTEGNSGLECGGKGCEATVVEASVGWEDSEGGVGEGGGGVGVDEDAGGGAGSSFGISKLEMSSPSSARRAISFPTGTCLVPSGAWI